MTGVPHSRLSERYKQLSENVPAGERGALCFVKIEDIAVIAVDDPCAAGVVDDPLEVFSVGGVDVSVEQISRTAPLH